MSNALVVRKWNNIVYWLSLIHIQMCIRDRKRTGNPAHTREVAQEINKLTKKVDRNNKKQEDQVQQHRQEVTRKINEVREITTEQIQNISQLQKNDEKLNKIINQLQSDPRSKLHKIYTWLNQKLYRQEKRKWRLVLTKELGEDCLLYTSRCV